MTSLRVMTVHDFKSHHVSMTNIRRLWEGLHGHEIIEEFDSLPTTSRPDLPVLQPGGRGSIKRALDLTVADRENALIAKLEEDMYAQSSKKPRETLWKTYEKTSCSMAQAWRLPPVPLTEELIVKVGASFKAGHYKSPQNYFSRALQNTEHSPSNTHHHSATRSSRTSFGPSPEAQVLHLSKILSRSNSSTEPSIPMTSSQTLTPGLTQAVPETQH